MRTPPASPPGSLRSARAETLAPDDHTSGTPRTPGARNRAAGAPRNRGTRIFGGDLNIPLIEGLGLRVTGELERSGSFIDFSELERDNFTATLAYEP
jgi:hypothetical protein